MADPNAAQKALLYVDTVPLVAGTASIVSSAPAVAIPINVPGPSGNHVYIKGLSEGEADIDVDKDGRHGTLHVTVVSAPLVLTLGIPEPH